MATLELLLMLLCVSADFVYSRESLPADCCPREPGDARVSGYVLLKQLTQPCLYNSLVPPGAMNISTRVYIYNSQAAQNLRYNLHLLLQLEYHDPRLAYYSIAPNVYEISGGDDLLDLIWTPHVYLVNNQNSKVMGAMRKDIRVTVYPDGTVIFAERLKTTLTCWMKLYKFPFDEQRCSLVIDNWVYNNNGTMLEWNEVSPVSLPPQMHMAEYYVSSMWTETSKEGECHIARFHKYKQSIGSHGALVVTFRLRHEVGYYIMDYYMPSVLLVVTSWVAFWLDTDAVSGRINIGISTILTFITLSCQTGSAMPTVSYIMASEVWFIACTAFIIGSLVEFAFVNTIWRRRRHVELKKVTGKHILKSTLTPKLARKQIGRRSSSGQTSSSSPSEVGSTSSSFPTSRVSQIPLSDLDRVQRQEDETQEVEQTQDCTNEDSKTSSNGKSQPSPSFTTMTPQQIAKWIDKRSRVLFPVSFLVFNIVYWGFIFLDVAQKKSER